MIRIFAHGQDRVELKPEDAHHLLKVLRVQLHEVIELLMDGQVYEGTIQSLKPLIISKGPRLVSNHELPFSMTLIYPLPKGDRLDWVVQKATELGTFECVACRSERSIVKWSNEEVKKKLLRYQRIIAEATLQSKREKQMIMDQYLSLSEAINLPFDQKWVASEYHQEGRLLADIPFIANGARVAILVGPEGGFSPAEIQAALQAGFQPVSLGKTILRTETAVTAALTLLAMKGISSK